MSHEAQNTRDSVQVKGLYNVQALSAAPCSKSNAAAFILLDVNAIACTILPIGAPRATTTEERTMTGKEIRDAMLRGVTRFRHVRTGRVFSLDPAQESLLRADDADRVLLIGHPIRPHLRQRGRKWQWLAPKNLEAAD